MLVERESRTGEIKLTGRDAAMSPRVPAIAEAREPSSSGGVAREQKITPFDVEGGVDDQGRSLGM